MKERAPLLIGLGLAIVAHVLIVDRFLLVLADDVEALLHNLHLDWTTDYAQAWYANTDWIPRFRAALRVGLTPASVLVIGSLLFRLREVLGFGLDPLPELSSRTRRIGAAAALLGLALASFPLSLGLSMWTAVEAYAWVEWYGHAEPLMQDLYNVLPLYVLPGVLLIGALSTVAALVDRRSVLRNPWRFRRLRQIPGLALGAIVAAPLAAVLLVGSMHAPRVAELPGRAVWAPTCGQCHERTLPLYYVKTPDEWQETVRTHTTVEGIDLTDAQADDLHGFLTGMRGFDDAWAFRTRCQNCHGSGWRQWPGRTEAQWADVVRRLARWSPYYYSPKIEEQIVRYISTAKHDPEVLGPLTRANAWRDVVDTCDPCHSVTYEGDRYAALSREETLAMVMRMNQKLVEPLSEDELQELTDDYIDLLADRELFDRAFPHDLPQRIGGGL